MFSYQEMRSLITLPDEKARITLPHKMVEKHKRAVLKSLVKKEQSKKKYHGTYNFYYVLVSCTT